MPGKFNYEERHKYPHLVGEDTIVWERFIKGYPNRFDTVDYDVSVGQGIVAETISDEKSNYYWANITKKRIDVIGYKDDIITIIEVKRRVSLYALGQILGYKFLFLQEHPEVKAVRTLIICAIIDQDDSAVLNYYGIDFIVV